MGQVPARSPQTFVRPPAAFAEPRVLESLKGFVEILEEGLPDAEVVVTERGTPVPWLIPAHRLRAIDVRQGESFWVDVLERADGSVEGRLRKFEPESKPAPPDRYLTPDELAALEGPWS
jgi:hypothetical protein